MTYKANAVTLDAIASCLLVIVSLISFQLSSFICEAAPHANICSTKPIRILFPETKVSIIQYSIIVIYGITKRCNTSLVTVLFKSDSIRRIYKTNII